MNFIKPTFRDPKQRQDHYGPMTEPNSERVMLVAGRDGVYAANHRRNRWRLWLMLVVVVAIGYGMFRLGWFDVAEAAR